MGATRKSRVALREQEFQSSPTPEGGRYAHGDYVRDTKTGVSILAHPGGWALPRGLLLSRIGCQFQSSPTPEGGRYNRELGNFTINKCFNPRPPRRVGATSRRLCARYENGCFNPRPPRRVGATH
uniref:Uncharacterized protein n=1 Tax=mine drainage metagenome TaxID=410659 RepID=E6QQG0_9ZZZZ